MKEQSALKSTDSLGFDDPLAGWHSELVFP